jgi:hypothetical protein
MKPKLSVYLSDHVAERLALATKSLRRRSRAQLKSFRKRFGSVAGDHGAGEPVVQADAEDASSEYSTGYGCLCARSQAMN